MSTAPMFGGSVTTTSSSSEFGDDVIIKGNIYLDGDICQSKEKMAGKKSNDNDIEVEVVDNGFMAKIGPKTFVFSNLDELDKWMKDNFSNPKEAKKTIREAKGLTKPQQDLLDTFEKLSIPKPIIAPQPLVSWEQPMGNSIGTTTTYPTVDYNTTTTSGGTDDYNTTTSSSDMQSGLERLGQKKGILGSLFGKKTKEKK